MPKATDRQFGICHQAFKRAPIEPGAMQSAFPLAEVIRRVFNPLFNVVLRRRRNSGPSIDVPFNVKCRCADQGDVMISRSVAPLHKLRNAL